MVGGRGWRGHLNREPRLGGQKEQGDTVLLGAGKSCRSIGSVSQTGCIVCGALPSGPPGQAKSWQLLPCPIPSMTHCSAVVERGWPCSRLSEPSRH